MISVASLECAYLAPGESTDILIVYSSSLRQDLVTWVCAAKYDEWQDYIFEYSHSRRYLDRERAVEVSRDAALPHAVPKSVYPRPTRILAQRAVSPEAATFLAQDLSLGDVAPDEPNEPSPPKPAGPEHRIELPPPAADVHNVPGPGTPGGSELSQPAQVFLSQELQDAIQGEDATVFYHEGFDDIMLEELHDQLAVLPDIIAPEGHADIKVAYAGEPGETTPEEFARLKAVLRRHEKAFLGSGNALPPAARGVECDLEVENGTIPIAQQARQIPDHLLPKVCELLKRLLESGIVEMLELQ
ncbi:hypothetical protein PybrP1_009055 [[Pythium] brassicae (nom. inval.)]|nr:hypothetical protein PybrP1_009055 [[Pythium] brassicae (nom. inval.)]